MSGPPRQPISDVPFRTTVGIQPSDFLVHGPGLIQACENLLKTLETDEALIKRCASKTGLRVNLDDFNDVEYVVRKGFPYRNERIEKDSEKVKYFLAHATMARLVLKEILVPGIHRDATASLQACSQLKGPFSIKDLDRLQPAMAQLARAGAMCANTLDVMQEYEENLGEACSLLDKTYAYKRPNRSTAHVYEFELTGAAWDVLLSKNAGRHAPAPLIRAAIDVGIVRLVLDPEHTTRYRDRTIEPTWRLNADVVLDVCREKNIEVLFGADSMKRLYEWGSVFLHRGFRYPHEELWYALRLAEASRKGFVKANGDAEAMQLYDQIVEELHRRGLIEVYDADGNLVPPVPPGRLVRLFRAPRRLSRKLMRRLAG